MSRMSPHTLGDLIASGIGMNACCYAQGCHNSAALDLAALAAQLGIDHPYGHHALTPKLRCSKCGSKDVGIRLATKSL